MTLSNHKDMPPRRIPFSFPSLRPLRQGPRRLVSFAAFAASAMIPRSARRACCRDLRTRRRRLWVAVLLVPLWSLAASEPLLAAALPWDDLLSQIQESLSGTTVRAIATIIVLVTGLLVAAGETRGFSGTFLRIVFGLSIAIGAASWISFFTDKV